MYTTVLKIPCDYLILDNEKIFKNAGVRLYIGNFLSIQLFHLGREVKVSILSSLGSQNPAQSLTYNKPSNI